MDIPMGIARPQLTALFLQAAETGEPVTITHRGRAIGTLHAVNDSSSQGEKQNGMYACQICGRKVKNFGTSPDEMADDVTKHLDHPDLDTADDEPIPFADEAA